MAVIRVGGRGQITLPSGIREALGIAEGRRMVCYVNEAGDILIHPLPAPKSVDEVAGLIRGVERRPIEEALERAAGRYGEEWGRASCAPSALRRRTPREGRREMAAARDASWMQRCRLDTDLLI